MRHWEGKPTGGGRRGSRRLECQGDGRIGDREPMSN